jgi:PAS domain S-box-containing protein
VDPAADTLYALSKLSFQTTGSPHAGEPHSKGALRQKAEAQLRMRESVSQEKPDALSPETMRTILHELRLHQIELELQNEELRAAQAALDASRAHYFDLYDMAPVGYLTVNESGIILEANLTAATLLGVHRTALEKQPFPRFVIKEDSDIFHLLINQPLETGWLSCDLRMVKSDGTTFWAHLMKVSAQDEKGESQCRIVLSDITECRRPE